MSSQNALPDGTWIDNFRVARRLGRGGFGVTYLAEEYREWEAGQAVGAPLRLVAIKEFFPRGLAVRAEGFTVQLMQDVDGAEATFQMALKGFFQEAESLMRFDHPNVIKIHRVFQRNQTAYYVMPFMKGETLRALIKRDGSMGEERARRLLLPVLDGLLHAHAKGILHRDIKPENVMIPDEGGPVLIDFGAARAQAMDDAQRYTRYSELVAYTPGYAALEQYHRATRENLHGAHTDVYGLAAVFYHCITGEAPVESSMRALELSNGRPDPMVPASVRLMDTPGYGRAFLAAIDWGLELPGKDRPQSLADFRRALDGRFDLPAVTLDRLAKLGVSTEPFTRIGATVPTAHLDQIEKERKRLEQERKAFEEQKASTMREIERATGSSRGSSMEDAPTVMVTRQRSGDTMPLGSDKATSPGKTATTGTAPPGTAKASAPPASGGSGKGLVLVGLLITLGAAIYFLFLNDGPLSGLLPGGERKPAPVQQTASNASVAPTTAAAPPPSAPAAPPVTPAPAIPEPAKPEPAKPEPATPEPAKAETAKPEPASGPSETERQIFEAAKLAGTLEGWKAFRKRYPKSDYAPIADTQIAALQAKARDDTKAAEPPKTETATTAPVPPAPAMPKVVPRTEVLAAGAAAGHPRDVAAADCAQCPELVSVPGGTYEMGDVTGDGEADEKPVRSVTIQPMKVGRYEVTFDEWDACVAGAGCSRHATDSSWGRGRRPAINVSWSDAQQYIRWLSKKTGRRYRLPSEAEFEYFSRAGSRSRYPWGDDSGGACRRANVSDAHAKAKHPDWTTFGCDDGFEETAPVGSFAANAFGLYDTAGNVWEWTEDCYRPTYRGAPIDGSAVTGDGSCRRIIRGGSWSDAPVNLRSADRTAGDMNRTLNIVGFRVVREP